MHIQTKCCATYDDAVEVAKLWYKRHTVGYGINISYFVPEINEYIQVRNYYLINGVGDIK